ncbi:hypothetical protein RHMOL_Rhmol06G0239400 [Rhododendron molle]|uniref:Uncharacterized protein n=1 Tax=Rhododendron molle TaxID=49168 RepID=A0ACC0NFS8_RHOML|nr:hypothetical protein RHMOL_Rhmol06G0239400 [Rhododendron molle]
MKTDMAVTTTEEEVAADTREAEADVVVAVMKTDAVVTTAEEEVADTREAEADVEVAVFEVTIKIVRRCCL